VELSKNQQKKGRRCELEEDCEQWLIAKVEYLFSDHALYPIPRTLYSVGSRLNALNSKLNVSIQLD
jgi:hypothetical protein